MSKAYKVITDQIIELMENNQTPWAKPWSMGKLSAQANFISGRPYTGANAFFLAMTSHIEGKSNFWITFNQIRKAGIKLKKGSKSTAVIGWFNLKNKNADDEKDTDKKTGKGQETINLRASYYRVFNIDDCEQLTDSMVKKLKDTEPETFEHDPIDAAEKVINNMQPKIEFGRNAAFYVPSKDFIGMVDKERFETIESYYGVLFHELTHWTGHKSRLDRKEIGKKASFGSEEYSEEELCAEMGSVFICSEIGLSTESNLRNSSAYIKGWLKFIKSNPKAFVMACQRAQKACDYALQRNQKGGE